jgi:hypothetical protein
MPIIASSLVVSGPKITLIPKQYSIVMNHIIVSVTCTDNTVNHQRDKCIVIVPNCKYTCTEQDGYALLKTNLGTKTVCEYYCDEDIKSFFIKRKSEHQYLNGKEHGLCTRWYDNESNTLEQEIEYVDGKKHGKYRKYHNISSSSSTTLSGQKLHGEGQYVDDVLQGTFCWYWNSDGNKLKSQITYVDGKQQGLCREW